MPLHCFFRTKTDPVFRILRLEVKPLLATVLLEHGSPAKGGTQTLEVRLRRLRNGQWIEEWRR